MVDLVVTPASVIPASDAGIGTGTAGATLTAGMAIYKNTTTGKYEPADADASTTALVAGIALHGASANQPISFQKSGNLAIGATVVVGQIYVASATAGGIAPYADLASGDFVSIIGVADTASTIDISIVNSGTAKA